MRRREFITMLGGIAAWPIAGGAQQATMPVVGWLGSASPESWAHFIAEFQGGLSERGYYEGRNVLIEYRWAENQYDRLPALAADLVHRQVAVIVASGGTVTPMVTKAATSTIPIVFTGTPDPVSIGLVASLNRPGGNVTGTSALTAELDAKRLELLRQLVPIAGLIAALINSNRPDAEMQSRSLQEAAHLIGQQLTVLRVSSERDLGSAFANLAARRIDALLVGADPFFASQRVRIVELAAHHALPAVYMNLDFVAAGGLASYGTDIGFGYRQAGIYVGEILSGAKPADLPVVIPTKFELAVNLKAAKALGLEIPTTVLARADEVIE